MKAKDEARWDQRLEELRLVAEANGGVAEVSVGEPERVALRTWCNRQALPRTTIKLTANILHVDGNQTGRGQYRDKQ